MYQYRRDKFESVPGDIIAAETYEEHSSNSTI